MWEMLLILLFGGAGFLLGVFVRLGHLRRFTAVYLREELPSYIRNAPFAAAPFGATLLLWWLGLALDIWGASAVLSVYVFLFSLPLAILGLFVSLKGPSWSKPAWLIEPGQASKSGRSLHLSRLHYAVAWLVVVGGSLAVWALLDQPLAGLLAALTFAIPMLLSVRPTRRTDD